MIQEFRQGCRGIIVLTGEPYQLASTSIDAGEFPRHGTGVINAARAEQ
jgi:hypothetical protein